MVNYDRSAANAHECLISLSEIHLSERRELSYLNDQHVELIEHVHFLEAENSALAHDRNLIKSGFEEKTDGLGIMFETELANLKAIAEDLRRSSQHNSNEEAVLRKQVEEYFEKWRSLAHSNTGIPKDIDADFIKLSQIEAENNLVLRRIKYMEDKNRNSGAGLGALRDTINLMRMRKDQAVSLHNEYLGRQTDIVNSIRLMEEENKRVIMNEHKYFTSDRTHERHIFRDQLHQAIADLRAEYENKRLINEKEIKIRTESIISRIQYERPVNIWGDEDRRTEITRVKKNVHQLHQQLSEMELRNAQLEQQIEMLQSQTSEDHRIYELCLAEKEAEISKIRDECTRITVELEKFCDLNISLAAEIEHYRALLDGSYVPKRPVDSVLITRTKTNITSNVNIPPVIPVPDPYYSPVVYPSSPLPPPVLPPKPLTPIPIDTFNEVKESYRQISPLPRRVISTPEAPLIPMDTYHRFEESRRTPLAPPVLPPVQPIVQTTTHHVYTPYESIHRYNHFDTNRESSIHTTDQSVDLTRYSPAHPVNIVERPPAFEPYRQIHEERTISTNENLTGIHHSSSSTAANRERRQTVILNKQNLIDQNQVDRNIEVGHVFSEDESSSDEEHFQRFTRWYKGRVKITDVTPEYINIENRSSKKSASIGGFRIIHEFGQRSVFIDLPSDFILAPKNSLRIYARKSIHEPNSVVADIDEFDTTPTANTSFRNTNNEVKSWFVYISNTEKEGRPIFRHQY